MVAAKRPQHRNPPRIKIDSPTIEGGGAWRDFYDAAPIANKRTTPVHEIQAQCRTDQCSKVRKQRLLSMPEPAGRPEQ